MKKVLIETTNGETKELRALFDKENMIHGSLVLGADVEESIMSVLFYEIVNSLIEEKISLNDIKSITFEEIKEVTN
jgi:hypothetical protein